MRNDACEPSRALRFECPTWCVDLRPAWSSVRCCSVSLLDFRGIDSADVSGFHKRQRVACRSRGAWHSYALRGCVYLFPPSFFAPTILFSPLQRSHCASRNNSWRLVTCTLCFLFIVKDLARINQFHPFCGNLLDQSPINSVMQTSKYLFLPKTINFFKPNNSEAKSKKF